MAKELELVPAGTQLPAHLAARMNQPSSLGSAITGGINSGIAIPRISIKGSRFRVIEDGAELVLNTLEMDAIIVGANPQLSKTWYEKKWNPDDEPAAPDCFSHNGIRPDVESTKPQATACVSCPHNQWGSRLADNGQKLKACADAKRLALVSSSDPNGTVYLLSVTPAALKGLNQYHRELAQKGIPAEVVITKIGFDTTASFPKLTFRFGGFIPQHEQEIIDQLIGSDQVNAITGEDKAISHETVSVSKPTLVRTAEAPVTIEAEYHEVPPPPAPAQAAPAEKKGFAAQAAPAPATAPVAEKKGFAAQASPAAAAVTTSAALSDKIKGLLSTLDDDDADDADAT